MSAPAYQQARETNTPSHCADCGRSLAGAYRSFNRPDLCTTCSVCRTSEAISREHKRTERLIAKSEAHIGGLCAAAKLEKSPATDLIGRKLAAEAAQKAERGAGV